MGFLRVVKVVVNKHVVYDLNKPKIELNIVLCVLPESRTHKNSENVIQQGSFFHLRIVLTAYAVTLDFFECQARFQTHLPSHGHREKQV